MKVHHTLICFFFLSLQDGNPEVTSADFLYYGVTGEDVTVRHAFQSSGTWKIFCKEECEGEHILINTTDVRGQRGRYSTEFKKESTYYILSVSISQLTESDSGQYRCGLGGSSSSPSYVQFGIFVSEALLDGNDDPSQQKHFYKEPGSSLTVGCSFKDSGSRKLFCRGECGGDSILIQTNEKDALTGKYRIGSRGSFRGQILYVSITQLSKSDSGWYRCSLDQTSSSFRDFEITVTDAVVPSASTPSHTFSGTTEQSESTSAGVPLYVGLPLAVTIILLSAAVLIFCKKRSSKPKDHPGETDYAAVREANVMYEEIIDEERQNRSPPVEITSVYSLAKFTNTNAAETTDDYSVITAATSEHKAEDDSSKPSYSELNVSKTDAAPSSTSSEPQVKASQSGENPLYSALT